MAGSQVFILSPARCDGERAKLLLSGAATFPLAIALREGPGAEIGEVFSFLSSLYFRGKLTYARAFASRTRTAPPIQIVTTDRGLVPPETRITLDDLRAFAGVDIATGGERYLGPLRRDVAGLASTVRRDTRTVLLGSIATGKYVDVLLESFGERLVFPSAFVGRGDMSRGGLMLRCVMAGYELPYVPLSGAIRHGQRPPKLEPLKPRG